jgi:hypothetical protein
MNRFVPTNVLKHAKKDEYKKASSEGTKRILKGNIQVCAHLKYIGLGKISPQFTAFFCLFTYRLPIFRYVANRIVCRYVWELAISSRGRYRSFARYYSL